MTESLLIGAAGSVLGLLVGQAAEVDPHELRDLPNNIDRRRA